MIAVDMTVADFLASIEAKPSPIAPPPTVSADLWSEPAKPAKKSGFITRKDLIEQLRAMKQDEVLVKSHSRYMHGNVASYAGHEVKVVMKKFMPCIEFGAAVYCMTGGKQKPSPKWFRQLYANLSWTAGDITPASILELLK